MSPTPRQPLPAAARSLELTPDAMQAASDACVRFAIDHIASLPEQPAADLVGAAEVAARFREPPPTDPVPLATLLERFATAVPKSRNTASPGYLAYIPGGGLYPAALADFLALAVNRYVGVWHAAPALVQIEATAIDWLRDWVGYPAGAAGLLTSGGSMSNLIGIVTARRARLGDEFADAVIYTSEEAHHSIHKSAVLAGFPERNLRVMPVDARFRLQVEALAEAVAADRARGLRPFLVAASAGTTNTGAVDPLPAIADLCARESLWLHVDAAYGGFFRLAPGGAALLPGLERADSLVLDPHKGLFLPYGTGCLLVRDADALRRAHTFHAGYLQDLEEPPGVVSFANMSPELSREFRGLRLWLPLQLFGIEAFRDNLREKLELARWAAGEIAATPGFELIDPPQLSVVAFRYLPQRGDADDFNARLLRGVNDLGRVHLSSTRSAGRFVLRICVLSFRTHADRVQVAVDDLRRVAQELEIAITNGGAT
jgi:aromatic-L-amino-acid decarboxylase